MSALITFLPFMQLSGAKLSEGVFVGSFLSMSSTAVVTFITVSNCMNYLLCLSSHQITEHHVRGIIIFLMFY